MIKLLKNNLYLFWKVGKYVFEKEKIVENSIDRYSKLCSYHYGSTNIFSRENVRFMKRFYVSYPVFIPVLENLDWEHYVELLRISDRRKQYFYFRLAHFCRISVDCLKSVIDNNFYENI